MQDKDHLLEQEEYELVGDDGLCLTLQRAKSLFSRFVIKALDILNSRVSRNWSRFDQFHELIQFAALGDISDIETLAPPAKIGDVVRLSATTSEGARVGLEYLFKVRYLTKASDFMLGRKSPLMKEDERRIDMGGSYT